jgi:hypothetical protein
MKTIKVKGKQYDVEFVKDQAATLPLCLKDLQALGERLPFHNQFRIEFSGGEDCPRLMDYLKPGVFDICASKLEAGDVIHAATVDSAEDPKEEPSRGRAWLVEECELRVTNVDKGHVSFVCGPITQWQDAIF